VRGRRRRLFCKVLYQISPYYIAGSLVVADELQSDRALLTEVEQHASSALKVDYCDPLLPRGFGAASGCHCQVTPENWPGPKGP
jgi:hypothetical protein